MKIRTECPRNNKYYIRKVTGGLNGAVAGNPTQKYANVLDNCVGYANGRFNESINDPDLEGIAKAFKYQLVCDAEDFIESAKRQGLKISSTPIEGGVMVWQKGRTLSPSDGAGHVAFVERVYDDGSIMTSESGWASWAFKTVRRDNKNGRWGQNSNYTFRGCIINPSIKDPKVVPVPPLTVDGIGGACTIRATQRFFDTPQDGVLSGQNRSQSKFYPSITAVEFGKGGSPCVKKLQKWCGASADGVLGANTIKSWQKKLKAEGYYNGDIDAIFGKVSMKAWQNFLNDKLFKKETTPQEPAEKPSTPSSDEGKPPYKVIDVSDWQDKIDWARVKASGVVGAIIRYADGNTLDKRFAENMKGAKAAGLHIGSYIFSRAKSIAEAQREAERLFNACKPYAPDMPLYIDLEASGLGKYADECAIGFLTKMKALGGRGGVYANLNWWNNYLKVTARDYSSNPFWIAQYNDTMDYKPADRMGMWQYTSSGTVDGIKGKVDMDKCFIAYWKTTEPSKPTDPPKKSVEELAIEVLQGKWGKGDERKKRLTEAGYVYDAVQKCVNELVAKLDKIIDACKVQAEWMEGSKYDWESNPTIAKSKKRGTCVTYVACVLQRLGILPSGRYVWHDEGKVYGNNDKMTVTYPDNKTLHQLKGELIEGDIVIDGDKHDNGSGSHIFILTGKWKGDNPVVWDNHSAQEYGGKSYTYTRNRHVIAIIRLR